MADKKSDAKGDAPAPRGDKFIVKMERGAQKAFLEEIFNDIYAHRLRIYVVNFIRGFCFTLGGIIGATLGLAIILWILSLFNNVPFVGQYFKSTQQTIQGTKD